jgi:hypothetical protein
VVDKFRSRRNRYFELPFVDEGGTNVPAAPVLSSNILGDTFVSVYEGVSLLVVTVVEDLNLEFSAISSKLGRCLTWLSACCIAATSTSTATLTCLGSSRWTTASS